MHVSVWMSEPQFNYAEVAYQCGIRRLVIDIEHGLFTIPELDRFLGFTKAKGMTVIAKVAGAYPEAIQQAIDCGADGVIIPHIRDAAHARELCAVAKYPTLGTRSYFGGRPVGFQRPSNDFYDKENRRIRCFPLIELPSALEDVEAIAALDVVDGIFPGPSDLSLSSGRGTYGFADIDKEAIRRCALAARNQGKQWIMPAWTPAERLFGVELQASELVLATQFMIYRQGITGVMQAARDQGIAFE